MEKLTPNDEQLVTDLAADYSERMIAGADVTIQEYLDKLPSEETRRAFRTLANMSRFMGAITGGQDESTRGTGNDHSSEKPIQPIATARRI